jgi:hypothetical protein
MATRGRGRPKNPPNFKEILNSLIPASDIFTEDELQIFNGLVNLYLQDFDESQLTANDMDDIISIASNRVLEIRLLKAAKDNTDMQIDASTAIERLRKQTDKLKESLAARRKDRIDPKKFSGLSIVDLVVAYDEEEKRKKFGRTQGFLAEEEEAKKSELLIGNRLDQDAEVFDKDEE